MKKFIPIIIIALAFHAYGDGKTPDKSITVFHAGSLSVPMKLIAQAYEKENPHVKVLLVSAGSVECARKITELKQECDVFASADYTVIDKLLIPEYAGWNIKFAGNEMAIVYTDKAKQAAEINEKNWYNILLSKDVVFGRANPNSDPCGYRAVQTIELAEKYYGAAGLREKMLAKDAGFIRPKEVDLLALIETNTVDYIYLYKSVAIQHGLKYLVLPDEINLKKEAFADYYKTASVAINGSTPGTTINQTGEPMIYGITIPSATDHPEDAIAFVRFFLEKNKGMKIIQEQGQASCVPAKSPTYAAIPKALKEFALE